jgi:predicted ATPase
VHLIPALAQDEREKLTADYTQLRLFRATSNFISEQAEAKPLVMLLDDLHWADTTSLSLLLFLARYLPVHRSHPMASTPSGRASTTRPWCRITMLPSRSSPNLRPQSGQRIV